jgi:hypothetical protein
MDNDYEITFESNIKYKTPDVTIETLSHLVGSVLIDVDTDGKNFTLRFKKPLKEFKNTVLMLSYAIFPN